MEKKKYGLYDSLPGINIEAKGRDDQLDEDIRIHNIIKGIPEGHPEAEKIVRKIEQNNENLTRISDAIITANRELDIANKTQARLIEQLIKNPNLTERELDELDNELSPIRERAQELIEEIKSLKAEKEKYKELNELLGLDKFDLN